MLVYYTGGLEKMKILKFLKGNKSQNFSFIKENNLEDWWKKSFNDRERKMIISESSNLLNNDSNSDKTAARTLYLLAGNVITKFYNKNPDVIINLLQKAAELSEDPMELFEIYSQLIKLQYEKENENQKSLNKTAALCEKQIGISAEVLNRFRENNNSDKNTNYPVHPGYQKLAQIRFKQGKKEEAVKLIKQAKKENWKGNWDQLLSQINSDSKNT